MQNRFECEGCGDLFLTEEKFKFQGFEYCENCWDQAKDEYHSEN